MSSGVQEDTTGTLSGRDGYSQFLAQSSIIRTVIINMWELWERVRSEVQTPGCSLHFIAKQRNRNFAVICETFLVLSAMRLQLYPRSVLVLTSISVSGVRNQCE